MPVVDINPNNSGTIKLGVADPPTDEFSCQVINFAVEPVANTTPVPGTFCQAPLTRNAKSSWQLNFAYLQDWGSTPSISQFLFDNDGKTVFFEFAPDVDGVPSVAGSFVAAAGSFGGDAGTSWQSTGTMAVMGVPEFTDAVALVADDELAEA